MPRVLILDDDENRHREFRRLLPDVARTHVYTATQAIRALVEQPAFDLVCLDHDLGILKHPKAIGEPGNGTDVAQFISLHLAQAHYPKQIMIHSWNRPGARRMAELITETGIPVTVKPFHV